jgi:hypothetical protein
MTERRTPMTDQRGDRDRLAADAPATGGTDNTQPANDVDAPAEARIDADAVETDEAGDDRAEEEGGTGEGLDARTAAATDAAVVGGAARARTGPRVAGTTQRGSIRSAQPSASDIAVHIDDRISAAFVVVAVAVFVLIFANGLLLGQGGTLTTTPLPTPASEAPSGSASESPAASASESPAASTSASPSGSGSPAASASGSPSASAAPSASSPSPS